MKEKTMSKKRKKPSENLLKNIVQKILAVTKPEKIILFGSLATGKATKNSDLDILIIQHSNRPRYKRPPTTNTPKTTKPQTLPSKGSRLRCLFFSCLEWSKSSV